MRKFIILLLATLLISCNDRTGTRTDYEINKSLKAIVDSFTLTNPGRNVYELYLDKISPYEGIIFLYAGEKSLTFEENVSNNQSPLLEIESNDNLIQVYSGAERYIQATNSNVNNRLDAMGKLDGEELWVVTDSCGVLTTYKKAFGAYPFFPLPILSEIHFNLPVMVDTSDFKGQD